MLISELAARAGLSPRALRHYEDRGLLAPARDTNGYRRYAEDDLVRVAQIKTMIDAGLSTEAIHRYIGCMRSGGDTHSLAMCPTLRDELDSLARRLHARQVEIHETQARLSQLASAT